MGGCCQLFSLVVMVLSDALRLSMAAQEKMEVRGNKAWQAFTVIEIMGHWAIWDQEEKMKLQGWKVQESVQITTEKAIWAEEVIWAEEATWAEEAIWEEEAIWAEEATWAEEASRTKRGLREGERVQA